MEMLVPKLKNFAFRFSIIFRMSFKVVVVDHNDSFTFNLVHLLENYAEVYVKKYPFFAEDVNCAEMDLIVFSPGPGKPADYPVSLDTYKKLKDKIPILGVCLGFQMIVEAEGGVIIRQNKVLHGVQTKVRIVEDSILFESIRKLDVGRYHSLQADIHNFPGSLKLVATDLKTGVPLAFENRDEAVFGMQFHPESFLTPCGYEILRNLLRFCQR